jgi:hypothetical protein
MGVFSADGGQQVALANAGIATIIFLSEMYVFERGANTPSRLVNEDDDIKKNKAKMLLLHVACERQE